MPLHLFLVVQTLNTSMSPLLHLETNVMDKFGRHFYYFKSSCFTRILERRDQVIRYMEISGSSYHNYSPKRHSFE